MKKKFFLSISILAIFTLIGSIGFASFVDLSKPEVKVTKEEFRKNQGIISNDEKAKRYENVINSVKNSNANLTENMEKFVIRAMITSELQGKNKNLGEAIKIAKENIKFDEAWIDIAVNEYGISYTEQEVDEYISNGPDKYPTKDQKKYAELLGLSLTELNHEFDRDHYIKQVIWLKLRPVLVEKYNISLDNKEIEDVNNILAKKYIEEVEQHYK